MIQQVYEPQIPALLGTASHYCEAIVLESSARLETLQHAVSVVPGLGFRFKLGSGFRVQGLGFGGLNLGVGFEF